MPTKTIELSPEDLSSLQRVLTSLSDGEGDQSRSTRESLPREQLHKMARTLLMLRKRRSEYLYRAMFGEPAYDMLLGLYVAEEQDGQPMTAARLADIAGVAQSSAARWIEYLVAKELIDRERHPTHKRACLLKLSCRGRAALDAMFADAIEAVRDIAI